MWKQDFKFKNPFIAFSNFFIIILIHYIHCSGTLIWGLEIKVDLRPKKLMPFLITLIFIFQDLWGFVLARCLPLCAATWRRTLLNFFHEGE